MDSNRALLGKGSQTEPNKSKQVQTDPNESKQVQMVQNGADREKVDFRPQANFRAEKCPQIYKLPIQIKVH